MSIYSYDDAKKYLDEALKARTRTLNSQEYKIANRSQRMADLDQLNKDVKKWEDEIKEILAANPHLNPNKNQKRRRGPTIGTIGFRA